MQIEIEPLRKFSREISHMLLRRLWVGMQTNDTEDSGTEDKIVLIINDDGVDRLYHTFPKINQDDQKRGAGNVYEVIVPDTITAHSIDPNRLTNSSIRVGIRDGDLWRPRHFVIWGEDQRGEVIPIANETHIGPPEVDPITLPGFPPSPEHSGFLGVLSGSEGEGDISFPLRRAKLPFSPPYLPSPTIGPLVVMSTTANEKNAGTSIPVYLTVRYAGDQALETTISPGGQNKADFLHTIDGVTGHSVGPGLTRDNIDSIELRIEGNNAWLPGSFFLMAVATKPRGIIPLVHIPAWNPDVMGWLSADPNDDNSRPLIALPRALVFDQPDVFQPVPPGGVDVGMRMTSVNGRTQVTMDFPELKSS